MFGSANRLLATIALAVGTTYIANRGKIRYAWVTLIPMVFVGITTCGRDQERDWNLYTHALTARPVCPGPDQPAAHNHHYGLSGGDRVGFIAHLDTCRKRTAADTKEIS